MFESILKQFTGGDASNLSTDQLTGHLSSMLGQASQDHTSGAIGDALSSLGAGGFGQSVQDAAQNHGPEQRGQIGSMLMQAIQGGGGNPLSVLSQLGIGTTNPQDMSHQDLGALATHVAENHGGSLAGLLGGAMGGSAGGSGGGLAGEALHLLGNPMVQQTAMNLAKRFMP